MCYFHQTFKIKFTGTTGNNKSIFGFSKDNKIV